MEVSKEQIAELRKQIISHISSTFPEDKQKSAIENINSMKEPEFIEFLKQNKLIGSKPEEGSQVPTQNTSPFRSIIEGTLPSYYIDENKECLAVLEINPISKGHIILIPKNVISESSKIPQTIFSLAKKISKKIKTKLKPKEISILAVSSLGEIIVNILPIYDNESLNSPRNKASEKELKSLKEILEIKKRTKNTKKPRSQKIKDSKIIIPKRMP